MKVRNQQNHYEQLGVSEDASPEEIKRAYRARARETHPDLKGGDAGAFAAVNEANEVLSDPSRRLLYDTTGESERDPIEVEVEQILLSLFSQALQSEQDVKVIEFVRHQVQVGATDLTEGRKKLNARKKKLEAKRGKITSKGAVNLAQMIIDKELKNISAGLAQIDRGVEVNKACIKALKDYSEIFDAPPASPLDRYSSLLIYPPQGNQGW
jgi:curved DNA-binding protein CbpA